MVGSQSRRRSKDDFCPKVKLFHIFMPVMRGHRMMLPEQSLVVLLRKVHIFQMILPLLLPPSRSLHPARLLHHHCTRLLPACWERHLKCQIHTSFFLSQHAFSVSVKCLKKRIPNDTIDTLKSRLHWKPQPHLTFTASIRVFF